MPDFVKIDRYPNPFLLHEFLYSYVAFAMDTNQLGNDVRISAVEKESEIWCGVPEKCQNFSYLSMFLSNSSTESQLVLAGNPKI